MQHGWEGAAVFETSDDPEERLPKLRSGCELKIGIELSVTVETGAAQGFQADVKQILDDLGLADRMRVEPRRGMGR